MGYVRFIYNQVYLIPEVMLLTMKLWLLTDFSVTVGEVAGKAGNEKESESLLGGRDIKVHGLRTDDLGG